jgi:glycosyltransferase involved in cell wall biosynthesis
MASNVNIVILWLYDARGERLLIGGLARWCRDAARLIRSHGYRVRIWQKSSEPFCRELEEDISVHGLRASLKFRGNRTLAKALEQRNPSDEPWLFVSQEIQGFGTFPRSVAVNHGIWWNGDFPWWKRVLNKRLQRRLILGSRATICVDTNYINWCHAELRGRREWEQRLVYVPNYADLNHFKPAVERRSPEANSPTILFPRRVMGENLDRDVRGAGFLIRAVEVMESQGLRPRVIFAGRGHLQGDIEAWARRRKMNDRVEVLEAPLDEMPALYARADVVVVPTLAHEGTSLSAIEGLVSGKPVVVSHIGGLGNIVVDRLNGYVCDLTPESLARAIRDALADSPLTRSPGVLEAVRASLGKDRWEKKIWSVMENSLGL